MQKQRPIMGHRRGVLLLLVIWPMLTLAQQQFQSPCDKPRNSDRPFCDSSLSIDARLENLLASLTLDEKIGMLDHESRGASAIIDLDPYDWWNEALHGVADSPGVHFRPPTEHSTVFPQVINLAASFSKQLFFAVGNATGNEARAFFNVGNSGLTFWSPNINIYRDPRWGRGHETPGEDPHLSSEYARAFIKGLQGNEWDTGFLKTSACCKHFSAYSVEDNRDSFNAVVNEQDLADTYHPVFKSCIQQANATCIMCAYNAVNGIPACADKGFLTGTIREKWGFDGYIVSDCAAVAGVQVWHNYTTNPSDTCRVVLDAGLDLECGWFFAPNLRQAVGDESVSVQMIDTALVRGLRVLMRLGYFEKDATRPYKDLLPSMVDSSPHRELALEAARQSIVLVKNAANHRKRGRPALPLDPEPFQNRERAASMALIGPHVDGTDVFLGNYFGIPSYIKSPVDEIRKYVPDLVFERGCNVSSFNDSRLEEAVELARTSEQVVLIVGIDTTEVEHENHDRINLSLPGLQNELIRRVLAVVQEPVIMFIVSGGALDLSEWVHDPRVGAIIWAGYLGQSAGEAMADVMFGVYNPAGRLPQTLYANGDLSELQMGDMNMRPGTGSSSPSPGRTYRFFTGQPVFPFGFGLSYTTFEYTFVDDSVNEIESPSDGQLPQLMFDTRTAKDDDGDDCALKIFMFVRNSGDRSGDHSVLWFLAPPNAGKDGRPLKSLVSFDRINNLGPGDLVFAILCLNRDHFQLANEHGEFDVVTGEWKLSVGELARTILVL